MAHSVIMETLTNVFEDVYSVNNDTLCSLEQELFGMKESFSHSLDLFIVVVIDLAAVVEHIANIRD